MPWFRCLICGENFPGQIVGESGPVGFYVTRFVEASDPTDAEAVAILALRTEPSLAPAPGWMPAGQSRVFFEEIEEVTAERVPAVPPGFAWHPMDDAEA